MNYQYSSVLLFSILLALSYFFGYTNLLVAVLFIVSSSFTYLLYAKDKAAAKTGDWRVSEQTLHTVTLCCGWPGAIIAQQRLRHKTKKQPFRRLFWLTVLINVSALIWLHSPTGQKLYKNVVYSLQDKAEKTAIPETVVEGIFLLTQFRSSKKTTTIEWSQK